MGFGSMSRREAQTFIVVPLSRHKRRSPASVDTFRRRFWKKKERTDALPHHYGHGNPMRYESTRMRRPEFSGTESRCGVAVFVPSGSVDSADWVESACDDAAMVRRMT